jgi:DNA ligase (NAD+)
MDISGVGPSLIETLIEHQLIKSPLDLYDLKKEDLINLERMADKSADNAIGSIATSRTRSFPRLLFGLGIKHIGINVAELIASFYPNLKTLEHIVLSSPDEITKIDGLGPKITESLITFFGSSGYQEFKARISANPELLDIQESQSKKLSNKLEGKSFVITGTLSQSRSYYENLIKENAGKVSSSVSSKTSYVLCGENPGSKETKALELKIPILDENEFLKLVQ